MKIPLNEFEIHVDEDILKRGLQYFKKGYVTAVDELSAGEYEATVEGSESYTVHMEVKNGVMNGCYCTCPYDWGPICKHEVAVMFYLQQEELGIESNPQKTEKKSNFEKYCLQKSAPRVRSLPSSAWETVCDRMPTVYTGVCSRRRR